MDGSSIFTIPGLDSLGQHIVEERWRTLNAHLSPWFDSDNPWYIALRFPANKEQRKFLLTTIQRAVSQSQAIVVLGDPHQQWEEQALLPLVYDLHFVIEAEKSAILLCHSQGWFDQPVRAQRQLYRPKPAAILRRVQALLHLFKKKPKKFSTIEARVAAFYKKKVMLRPRQRIQIKKISFKEVHQAAGFNQRFAVCRDKRTAMFVERELCSSHINRMAISRVSSLLEAHATYGPLGLLSFSLYPCTTELLLLERYAQDIAALHGQPEFVMADLRRDLIALYHGMHTVNPDLWKQHLLHEPPNSPMRQKYQKRLWPAQRNRVVQAIIKWRGCDEITATKILDLLLTEGLSGLIDWRCGLAAETIQRTLVLQRVLRTLENVTRGMESWAREEIERLVRHLLDAVHDVSISITIVPLLTEYPSSRRRRRWGRRLLFGLPAVMHRKHQRRQRVQQRWKPRSPLAKKPQASNKKSNLEGRLIAAFAQYALLTEQSASKYLRDFLTYGVLGLLPYDSWYTSIDQRLVSWLRLIKFGRLDGTIEWAKAYHHLCLYSHDLGTLAPSAQVARAIFNSIAKPSYWHGGKGSAVDGSVRQRATLTITGIPRLHECWLVISFSFSITFTSRQPKHYYMLLVVDEGSQLPMGGWLSKSQPTSREVGLAIYQAIWHPGVIEWPLHGIPEKIQIPATLVADGVVDLQRAATHLMTELEVVPKISLEGKSRIVQLRKMLQQEGPSSVLALDSDGSLNDGVVLQALLTSLVPRCFPDHRPAPVWASIRKYGVAMPGHDTLAAGCLLPATGDVEITHDGVRSDGRLYQSPWFPLVPRQKMVRREFPFFYPKEDSADPEPGIFVEVIDGSTKHLYHLNHKYT